MSMNYRPLCVCALFLAFISFNSNEVNAQSLSNFFNDAAQEQSSTADEETSEGRTFAELMNDASQEQSCDANEDSEGLTFAELMEKLVNESADKPTVYRETIKVEKVKASETPFLTENAARYLQPILSEVPATPNEEDALLSGFQIWERFSENSENSVFGVSGNNGTLWTLSLGANDQTIELIKQKAQNSEGESVKWYGPALKENVAYSENIYVFGQNAFRKDFVQELQSNNGYAFGVRNFNALVPRLNKAIYNETGISDAVTPLSHPNGVSFLSVSKIEAEWTNAMNEYTISSWNGEQREIPGFSGMVRYTISKLENGSIVYHLELKQNVWLSIVSARELEENGDEFSETICKSCFAKLGKKANFKLMEIALPAFKIEEKVDLLADPEIGEVFGDPNNCSLSFFGGDDQFVTKAEQITLFECSQSGLKAASVTTGECSPKGLPNPQMIVDEAFYFIVSCYDEEDEILMPTFIGRCNDPSESNEDASPKGVLR